MVLKIAWRNIWRNKRRTIITMISVVFALFFSLSIRIIQNSFLDKIKIDSIKSYTGFLQIHKKGYWDDRQINNVMEFNENTLKEIKGIKSLIPRIESFGLASNELSTKGVSIIGISPDSEDIMTNLKKKIEQGSYLKKGDDGIILGTKLSQYLNLNVGDTLVLFSSGYQGNTAVGLFPVKGILNLPNSNMDRTIVYMSLKKSQEFFSCQNKLTNLAIDLESIKDLKNTQKEISKILDNEKYELMNWEKLSPEIKNLIESKQSSTSAIVYLLYIIIGFNFFSTILMMISERVREFSIMVSIGISKIQLIKTVFVELFILIILSILSGILLTYPLLYYLTKNPIKLTGDIAKGMEQFSLSSKIPIVIDWDVIIGEGIVILFITMITMIYPLLKLLKLNITKGIK